MKTQEYITLENQYLAHNYHPLDVIVTRGRGVWVWDNEQKQYMDFLSGYSALNQGHVHKKIIKTLKEQAGKITMTARAFRNDQLGLFAKELCELTNMEMMIPMNSGAEAVETAIKLIRKWGYTKKSVEKNKAEIIVCSNNFHGRTVTIVGFSSEEQYKEGFGAFTPGFTRVPYNDIDAIEKACTKNTVAILLEPIQGEGGIILPKKGYLAKISSICKENNILFVLDEIQTGLGRTGRLFAYQHDNVKPDLLILGKALGGGCYPVSAVVGSKDILSVFKPGDHGSTFGGNPLAAAIARTSLKVLIEEKMVENSAAMGEYLMNRLQKIKSQWIKEIRGKGLFIGIELIPESGGARIFCEKLLEERLLCKETHDMVIRLAPPLVINKKQIDWAYKKIKKVLENN